MEPKEIRGHMLLRGKTMKQLAEMIGTSRQNIHAVVTGRTRSKKYRQAIADFIGKPIEEVFPVTKEKA